MILRKILRGVGLFLSIILMMIGLVCLMVVALCAILVFVRLIFGF